MRTVRLTSLLAILAALSVAAPAPAESAPPIYPGATVTTRPSGVGMKAPPPSSKTYVTSDDFAKVKSWYQTHLGGAQEIAQPGMEESEDAFLVGNGPSAMVIMIQSYKGKTYIVVGPPA